LKSLFIAFYFTILSFPQISFADCNTECDNEYTTCSNRWEDTHPSCGPEYSKCLKLCPPPTVVLNVCTKDCYKESYECKNRWDGIHSSCGTSLDSCLDLCP